MQKLNKTMQILLPHGSRFINRELARRVKLRMADGTKYHCLRCGWVSRAKKQYRRPCRHCQNSIIPITANMLKVARQCFVMGYTAITGAEAFVSLLFDPDDAKSTEIVYVYTEFAGYKQDVFPAIPEGFEYWSDDCGVGLFAGLVFHGAYPVVNGELYGDKEMATAIHRLLHYFKGLEAQHIPQIMNLGGLL